MPSDRPYPLRLPRHAVSPRQVARAGDVWRLFQEAAVQASSDAGYPPSRYAEEQIAFIVGQMTVEHHRARLRRGRARVDLIRRNLRGTIAQRELRLETPLGLLASASQRWVHVSMAGGALPMPGWARRASRLRAHRGPRCRRAPRAREASVTGRLGTASGSRSGTAGWTPGARQPPRPIDRADEARHRMAASGLDPAGPVPIWEDVRFRQAAVAGTPCGWRPGPRQARRAR